MDVQLIPIAITAGVSVLTTLLALRYGPTWKDRVDAKRARQQRSDQLLARYSEPLARAAYDLQSRLYNMRKTFLTSPAIPDDYRRLSTLWLLGQFLAWTEIVRREVQVIDYGDVGKAAELQRHLLDVSDILSSNSIDDQRFRVFRAEQRAIGELMVTNRTVGGEDKSDSLGYAEFVRCFEEEVRFSRWFEPLVHSMEDVGQQDAVGGRAVLIQRALIDLIDFFDPGQMRFPDLNERGKVPMPAGMADRKRRRPPGEIARFRYAGDRRSVLPMVVSWAEFHHMKLHEVDGGVAAELPQRNLRSRYLVALQGSSWTELHIVRLLSNVVDGNVIDDKKVSRRTLSGSQTKLINKLLQDLGRPRLIRPGRRLLLHGRRGQT